jgi:hypothetical protein
LVLPVPFGPTSTLIRASGCHVNDWYERKSLRINLVRRIGVSPEPYLIPTAEIVDSSNDFGGGYRAPGCQREAAVAARQTKTHTNGHSLWPLV